MSKFKEVMEVPPSYRMSEIDKNVLAPSIKEIQEKTDIKNIKVNKIKLGREIDKIEITFSVNSKESHKTKEVETHETTEKPNNMSSFDNEKMKLRSSATRKFLDNFDTLSSIQTEINLALNSYDLEKIKEKYNLF